jgi:hypothetical protein
MSMNWLPLTEYSSKYKVSISTLRRRIKTDDIKFKFADGKYLISDSLMSTPSVDDREHDHRPSLKADHRPPLANQGAGAHIKRSQMPELEMNSSSAKNDEPILTAANRLLTELKKAYSLILSEKEEQILHLKAEVADLKTLVRVLESENERLSKR